MSNAGGQVIKVPHRESLEPKTVKASDRYANIDETVGGKIKTKEAVPKATEPVKLQSKIEKNYVSENMNKVIYEMHPKQAT